MTTTELKALTRKELENMAKRLDVPGRHSMKKMELVKILGSVRTKKGKTMGRNGHPGSNRKSAAKNGQSTKPLPRKSNRLMSSENDNNGSDPEGEKDRLSVHVLDSQWLHVVWNFSQQILDRARVALGLEWHQAVPIIRVFEIDEEEGSSGVTAWVKDIEVSGNFNQWYVPVESSPCTYRLLIGYRAVGGNFFTLNRSSDVTIPLENSPATTERNQNGTALSRNNHLNRNGCIGNNGRSREAAQAPIRNNGFYSNSIEANAVGPNGNGSDQHEINEESQIILQAELIIHGQANPNFELTCLGDVVPLDESGSFSLRLAFPEGRQVIPVAAVTPDGKVKYTTVLGIVRNTKELEPQSMENPLL